MAFNNIDKVSMKELTDELQELINSKAAQVDLDRHTSNNTIHITGAERDKWNAILQQSKDYTDSKIDKILGTEGGDIGSTGSSTVIEYINTKLDTSVFEEWKKKLHQIAYTGSYNDLKDKPSNISFSDTANKAYHADEADHAKNADHATNANHATNADYATNAGHATTADRLANMEIVIGPNAPSGNGLWFDTNNSIMKCKYNGKIYTTRAIWA